MIKAIQIAHGDQRAATLAIVFDSGEPAAQQDGVANRDDKQDESNDPT